MFVKDESESRCRYSTYIVSFYQETSGTLSIPILMRRKWGYMW